MILHKFLKKTITHLKLISHFLIKFILLVLVLFSFITVFFPFLKKIQIFTFSTNSATSYTFTFEFHYLLFNLKLFYYFTRFHWILLKTMISLLSLMFTFFKYTSSLSCQTNSSLKQQIIKKMFEIMCKLILFH